LSLGSFHDQVADGLIFKDIIVFSNGEKLNPVTIEDIISGHPEVQGALVAGTGQFQPCLLLEPVTHPKNEGEVKAFIDKVWPSVIAANKETVAHGQIGRDHVIISSPEKPFLRAGKGTIQRQGTLKLYKDEIDELYEKAGQLAHEDAPPMDLSSEETLIQSIQNLFQTRLGIQQELEPDADFFSGGVSVPCPSNIQRRDGIADLRDRSIVCKSSALLASSVLD
jgi:hypothetical protein